MQVPFTQTKEYLTWQESVGNKTFYLEQEKAVAACVVLNLKVGKVLHCPFGPVFSADISEVEKSKFMNEIYKAGKELNCVFVRLEMGVKMLFSGEMNRTYTPTKNIFTPISIQARTYAKDGVFQPRLEWVLDLNLMTEEIYNNFSKNCRYSIRRSEKEIAENNGGNVKIEIVENNFQEYFREFVELMKETGERNNFLSHEEKYFEGILKSLNGGNLKSFLVVGKVKNDGGWWVVNSMAVIILDNENKRANYVYGGSRNFKRELGVSYKVQWEAIKHAKSLGCVLYNFGGITGVHEGQTFGRETLQGVTNFKKQFGGRAHFNGYFYDMPIQKTKYFLYLIYKMIK